jgi:hypothetical protein
MLTSQSLLWLVLTAATGTAVGWAYAHAASRRRSADSSGVQSPAMPSLAPTPFWAVAMILCVVALDAAALGLLAWSTLRAAGPENIRGAVVPLACLAGAAVIVALALGPILETIFSAPSASRGRSTPMDSSPAQSRSGDGSTASWPDRDRRAA